MFNIPLPPAHSKPSAFWFLNGLLSTDQIKEQLALMREKGIDEVVPHARYGLKTPYLSDAWFGIYDTIISEADRTGMRVWIYDELNWPSGHGGSKVCEVDELVEHYISDDGSLALETQRRTGSPDYLSRAAAQKFIEIAYEPYHRRYAHHFGKTIAGFFNDEVRFVNARPWSTALPWPLPADMSYWKAIRDALANEYFATIGEWCRSRNVKLIGHVMGEETMGSQVRYVGGAIFDIFEQFAWSGIDHLGTRAEGMHPRIAASSAYFRGSRQVFSETGAGLPWKFTSTDLFRIFGWLYANGITKQTMHGFYYAENPEDWPPDMFYRSALWNEMGDFVLWAGRVQHILETLTPVARVFVYYPVDEFMSDYIPDTAFRLDFRDGAPVRGLKALAIHRSLQELHSELRARHIDYLLAPSKYLPRIREGIVIAPATAEPAFAGKIVMQGARSARAVADEVASALNNRIWAEGEGAQPKCLPASEFISDPYLHMAADENGVHIKEFTKDSTKVVLVWNANQSMFKGTLHLGHPAQWKAYDPRTNSVHDLVNGDCAKVELEPYTMWFVFA